LIKYADLPLIIRCRALYVLGCSDEGDYVHYAEQSVHFAKLGLAATQEDGGDDTEGKRILRGYEKGLAAAGKAKAAADAKATTRASTENAEMEVEQADEHMEDDDEDDGEVVWDPDWDEERKAEAWAAQDRLAAAAAGASASSPQTRGEKSEETD
jgi:hypothetical protein